MRKFTISVLIGVALLIGCAAIISRDDRPHAATPALTFDQDADSVRLRGTWNAVLDARGNPVPTYSWTLRRNGTIADSGTVSATAIQRTFANPLPGDSAIYSLSVVAIDVRGVRSAPGTSPNLVVRSPWAAPPAPIVGLDTVAQGPPPSPSPVDSITAVVIMDDGTITTEPVFTRAGQTAQLCVIEWIRARPQLAAGQVAECDVIARLIEQNFGPPTQRAS